MAGLSAELYGMSGVVLFSAYGNVSLFSFPTCVPHRKARRIRYGACRCDLNFTLVLVSVDVSPTTSGFGHSTSTITTDAEGSARPPPPVDFDLWRDFGDQPLSGSLIQHLFGTSSAPPIVTWSGSREDVPDLYSSSGPSNSSATPMSSVPGVTIVEPAPSGPTPSASTIFPSVDHIIQSAHRRGLFYSGARSWLPVSTGIATSPILTDSQRIVTSDIDDQLATFIRDTVQDIVSTNRAAQGSSSRHPLTGYRDVMSSADPRRDPRDPRRPVSILTCTPPAVLLRLPPPVLSVVFFGGGW